jgi:hypothetical protein
MSVQVAVIPDVTKLAEIVDLETTPRPLNTEQREEALIDAYKELERKGAFRGCHTVETEVDVLREEFSSDDYWISDIEIERFVRDIYEKRRCIGCFKHEDVSAKDPEDLSCEDCRMV